MLILLAAFGFEPGLAGSPESRRLVALLVSAGIYRPWSLRLVLFFLILKNLFLFLKQKNLSNSVFKEKGKSERI